jgi:hypothetical protein
MSKEQAIQPLHLNIPAFVDADIPVIPFGKRSNADETVAALVAGKYVLIANLFSDGLSLLKSLKYYLKKKHQGETFLEQRTYREEYARLSQQVLLEIANHQITAKKSPEIGWLKILYPELEKFQLSFPQVQGLNSSWQWYTNGITIPVLRNKIHPYYGVYFPTRFDHLILFDNWLKRYEGPKKSAIDVGIGSGVLSFQLIKHGFQKSFGTDNNPNAMIGLQEAMEGTKMARKVELTYGDLFADIDKPTELIVFNPPWLAATSAIENLDHAIYYNEELFPAFFAAAKEYLLQDGKIAILFSNLGKITKTSVECPITKELEHGGRFELDAMLQRPVKQASEKTKRNQSWRAEEEVELWILKHKEGN